MDFPLKLNDFEYTICDSKGIRGVKDGKEYPISQDDWDRANLKHQDTDCNECTFVSDKETLLVYMIPLKKRETATNKPMFVGKFHMTYWVGHSSFYLFRCQECGTVTVDYPHGYHGEYMYLRCDLCRASIDLNSERHREFYARDNLHVPVFSSMVKNLRSLWATLKHHRAA